jgi:hypothetical protein
MQNTIRTELLDQINSYFRGEQWTTMSDRLEKDKNDTFHAHIFVNTCLHPLTLADILRAYFRVKGMEIDRPIDFQPSNVGHNMLHGVHPYGTWHFDLAWKYGDKEPIYPMEPEFIKEKNTLQFWDRKNTYEFFEGFPFKKTITEEEQKELDAFFRSPAWDECRGYVLRNDIAHFHMNVETSFHPDIIQEAGLKAILNEGWAVQKYFHCLFSPVKGWVTGKCVYLLDTPRVMFDIAWKYNGDVGVRSSQVPFMGVTEGKNDFDVRPKEDMKFFVGDKNFITLSEDEMKALEELFKG